MPEIGVRIDLRPLDRLARDLDMAADRLRDEWREEYYKLVERIMIPMLRAASPYRTGKLRRGWKLINFRGGRAVVNPTFYWRFVMRREAERIFREIGNELAVRAMDNVIRRFRV